MQTRAVLALVLACAFWGLSFPVTKALTEGARIAGPGASTWFVAACLVGVRFLLAALVLSVTRPVRPNRAEIVQGAALGSCTGAGMLLQTDALAYTEASTSAFLTQGYVVFLPLVSIALTRRVPPVRVLFSATLVLIGLAVLARFDPRSFSIGRGEAETLASAACFTIQILLLDARRFAHNRATPVTTTMFTTMCLVMIPAAAMTTTKVGDFTAVFSVPASAWYLLLLVLLPTLGSFLLMNRFQRLVSAGEAGIIYATEPVFASAFALVLPEWLSRLSGLSYANETLDGRLLVGGGLVVSANVLLALSARRSD